MALQWREPQNTIKPAKTLGEILIQLTLNYASPKFDINTMEAFSHFRAKKGRVQLIQLSNSQSKELSENQEIFFSDGQVSSPLRIRITEKWEIKTSSGNIPLGWEPFGYDSNDQSDPFLLRRQTKNWDENQKWQITTAGLKLPAGWEPFGYDYNDQQDPILLRRSTAGNWDRKQQWEIKTSNGLRVPGGWQPFAYDSKDEQDPFLLRKRIK